MQESRIAIPTEAARVATLTLLARRAPGATLCPSEVARALTVADSPLSDWRAAMPAVHAAVDQLLDDGQIRLSWKGKVMAIRAGPYRIGHGVPD